MPTKTDVDRALLLRIAGEASADPSTVRKVLAGGHVRTMARARVLRVLREHGLAPALAAAPLALATLPTVL